MQFSAYSVMQRRGFIGYRFIRYNEGSKKA